MALTDLFNIVHDMTLQSQNILNVYQVERANSGEVSATISDAFQNSILPSVRAWQSLNVTNNELRIFNLGNSLDFGTFSLASAPGLRSAAAEASFVAGQIKFPTRDRLIRNGLKRYAGILETDISDGDLVASAITLLDTLGTALIGDWLSSVDSHIVANFVIIKRVCTTTPPPGDPCPQYRLPQIGDPLLLYTPLERITITNARSQVSRRKPTP